MQRIKRLVVLLCGLFLVAQGLASVAFAAPVTPDGDGKPRVSMEHCRFHAAAQKADHGKCCGADCTDMASCLGACAGVSTVQVVIESPAAAVPASRRPGGLPSPDPDARLRPPTSLPG